MYIPKHFVLRRISRFFYGLTACAILLTIYGLISAQNTERAHPQTEEKISYEDLIHFGDLIDVDVVGGLEFDWRGTVTPEGYLDGYDAYDAPIFALCRSEKDVAADISKAYSKILRDPQVVVRIIDRSNRALARVAGAVRTPTRFSIRRPVTLQELLVMAGGIASGASGEIDIFRPTNLSCNKSSTPSDNGSNTTNIKITDLIGGKASSNPIVLSGDIVTVGKALPVYVIGAVNIPVPVFLTSQLTLSRAIAAAGGMTKEANGRTAVIFRRSGTETIAIEVDLSKIESGEIEDELLKPFDIIDVASRGGSRRKYPPASPVTEAQDPGLTKMPFKIVE